MRRLSNNAIAAFMVFIMLSSVISTTLISFYAQEKLKTTGKAVSQTGIVGIIVNGTTTGGGTPSGGGGGGGGGSAGGILVNKTHILDFRIKNMYVFDAEKDDIIITIFDYGNYTFVVEDLDTSKTKLVISSKSFVVSSDTTANLDLNLDGFDDLYIYYNNFKYTFVAVYPGTNKPSNEFIKPSINITNATSPQEFIPLFITKPQELWVLPLIVLIFVVFFTLVSFVLIPKYPNFGIIFVIIIVSLFSVIIYNINLPKHANFLPPTQPPVFYNYINESEQKIIFGYGLKISAQNVTNCRLRGYCDVIITINNTLNKDIRVSNSKLLVDFLDPLKVRNLTMWQAPNTSIVLSDGFRITCNDYPKKYVFLDYIKIDYVYDDIREMWNPVFSYFYKNSTTTDLNCTTNILKEKIYNDNWIAFNSESFVLKKGDVRRYKISFAIPDYSSNFYNFTFLFSLGSIKLDPIVQSGCGTLSTPNEIYEINQSIEGNNNNCLVVNANNVTIRCANGSNSVINITDTLDNDRSAVRTTFNDTTIENCHFLIKTSGTSIYGINAYNLIIRNVTINGTATNSCGYTMKGISLVNTSNVIINDSIIMSKQSIVGCSPFTTFYGLHSNSQSNNITMSNVLINATTYAIFIKSSDNLTIKDSPLLTSVFNDVVSINRSNGFLFYNNTLIANITNVGNSIRAGLILGSTQNNLDTSSFANISNNIINARNPIYIRNYLNSIIESNNLTQQNLSGAGITLDNNNISNIIIRQNNITSSNTTLALGINLTRTTNIFIYNNTILTTGVAGHGLYEIGNNSIVNGGNITVIGFGVEYPLVSQTNVSNLTIKNINIVSKASSGHCIYLQSIENVTIDSINCLSTINATSQTFAGSGLYLENIINGGSLDILNSNFTIIDSQRGLYFVQSPVTTPKLRVIGNNITLSTILGKTSLWGIDLIGGYHNSVWINNTIYSSIPSSRAFNLGTGSNNLYINNIKMYLNGISGTKIGILLGSPSTAVSDNWTILNSYFNITGTLSSTIFFITGARNWTIQDSVIEKTAKIVDTTTGVSLEPIFNTFLNVTYDSMETGNFTPNRFTLLVKYYLDVNVTNQNGLTPLANVNITGYTQKDNSSNPFYLEFSDITGISGFTQRLNVTSFSVNKTSPRVYYSNYTIYANSTTCNNQSQSLNITQSTQLNFILTGCPIGVVSNLQGGVTDTSEASRFGFGNIISAGKPPIKHILDFRIKTNYTFDVAKDDKIIAILNDTANYTFIVDVADFDKSALVLSSRRFLIDFNPINIDVDFNSTDDLIVNYSKFYYTFGLIQKQKIKESLPPAISIEKKFERFPQFFKIQQYDYTIILIIMVLIISLVLYIQFRSLRKHKK